MSLASRRPVQPVWLATVALVLSLAVYAAPLWAQSSQSAQSGKPDYDPHVEEVARSIFFELMSPY